MRSLGQIAAMAIVSLPLSAQQTPRPQTLPIRVAIPGPRVAKSVLPTRPITTETVPERIDKRRERMKDRDGEIDRILKKKAKRD